MKREILFRGKSKEGQWIEGYLNYSCQEEKYYIGVTELLIPVNPESVGQFTGLLDINGKKIFEGDYDSNFDVVMWCEKRSGWSMNIYDHPTKEFIECHCYSCAGNFEINETPFDCNIIGNIHDNPDLL